VTPTNIGCGIPICPAKILETAIQKLKQTVAPIVGNIELIHLNQFKTVQLLGKGGCGVVWKAVDVQTNNEVAVKVQFNDPNDTKNWFEEIKTHRLVTQHPSAPRVPKFIAEKTNKAMSVSSP